MQTNAGFIEHVEHTGESGADLGGQTDALGFPAREGHRRAIKAEVIETDVNQETQSHADLPQHQISDLDLTR